MALRRFFAPEITMPGMRILGNEAKHMSRVLRMQAGDMLVLFDGSGYDYTAEIIGEDENGITLCVTDKVLSGTEPQVKITVFQAVIKSDHFDFVVQKCTELGAQRFMPFISERCVKRPKSASRFVEREQRIALEAAKQCGRSKVPKIYDILDMEGVAKYIRGRFALLAYENEKGTTLKQALKEFSGSEVAVVIGPEGGFAREEVELLCEAGAVSVSLGKLILRAETAGAAALAMLRYEFDE